MWNVMQIWWLLSKKQKPGMFICKRIWLVETTCFLSHEFPEMEVFFRAAHGIRVSTTSVRQSEQIQEAVVDKPRVSNNFVRGLFPFEQECRATVVSNKPSNFLTS